MGELVRRVAPKRVRGRLQISLLRDYGIAFSFVVLFITLSLTSPVFFSKTNLLNLLDQSAGVGMIACGATLVLIAGGLDLSSGAVFAISGVIAAMVARDVGVWPGIAAGVLCGAGFGLINGLLSTVGRINAIIATLATGLMIRGLAIRMTGGFLVRVPDPSFTSLGRGSVLSIKYSVLLFLGVIVATWLVLSKTTFGRYVFASGGNPQAARLSGVRVGLIRTATFVVSGMTASLAGVLIASRVATGQPDTGIGLEIRAIAAVVIGGTSILGGEGAIWRSVLGVLLLALVSNGFNLLNVNPIYQQIFQGAIILGAVAIDAWSRRESA
jgi:ribose transport system permease protein